VCVRLSELLGYLDQEKLRKAASMSTAAAQLQAQNYSIEDKKLELVCSATCCSVLIVGVMLLRFVNL